MADIDLTPFGFTPTESLVYGVLLGAGRGTGYAIARQAGLARANAYAALEGLVLKGAARSEPGPPRRYRAEPPEALLARIAERQGSALDRLSEALARQGAPITPALVEITSPRGALQLLSHDIARAQRSVQLVGPADAFPLLAPALRRAAGAGLDLALRSIGPVQLDFVTVTEVRPKPWPGTPLVSVIDGDKAVIAGRDSSGVQGYWTSAPALVAAASHLVASFD